MKKIVIIFFSLIALIFISVLVIPKFIDWNSFKPKIAAAVKESTGRDLTINGDIEVSIFPDLEFSVTDIHLSNGSGMTETDMMSIESVAGKVGLMPLLKKRVVIKSFIIQKPVLHLEVNESGKPNWIFETTVAKPPTLVEKPTDSSGKLPISDLILGDVRVEEGVISYFEATTGKKIKAQDISLKVVLNGLASPFSLALRMALNKEPINIDILFDSPNKILTGSPAKLKAVLTSKWVSTGYEGGVQKKPVPGLNGVYHLDIPSVGKLAEWLESPLDPSRPDPGKLNVLARFVSDGAKVELKEASIQGDGLKAEAVGSFDGSGDITKIALNIKSGVLDIDRYLPPQSKEKKKKASQPSGDIFAALSDKPIDLSGFKKTEADLRITIGGVKAMGFEIGKINFTTILKKGVLTSSLKELSLYGGNVKGNLMLDASGSALALNAGISIVDVKVDKLAKAATGKTPVTGVASGTLKITANGASPKKIVESLKGGVTFDLGGVSIKDAPAGAISAIKINLDLPGLESSPTLKSTVVYNKKQVTIDLSSDPVKKVLSGNRFAIKLAISSKLLKARYEGNVQQQPVPGLDGTFNLDVPSVARLATWVGSPLDKSQPDPGPLKVSATFTSDGARATLKNATIVGKRLKLNASGSYDGSGEISKITLNIKSGFLDIDRYLPPQSREKKKKSSQPSGDIFAALSDKPIDLSGLKKTEADVEISIGGVKAMGFDIGKINFTTTLKKGVLTSSLKELELYGGTVKGNVILDGSGSALSLNARVNIVDVKVGRLVRAVTGKTPVTGVASGTLKITANGASPKKIVESLKGGITFDLGGVNIKDAPAGAISGIKINLDIPGLESSSTLKGSVVYNKKRVDLDLTSDPVKKVLSGNPFAVKLVVSSELVKAGYEGNVQQRPVPGLDGTFNLDVPSVAKFASWVGSPLDKSQPDPGPLKVSATFVTDGAKVTLKKATIEGKALKVRATGSFDGSGKAPFLTAKLDVDKADLNAYIPKSKTKKKAPAKKPAKKPAGWSDEPIDFSALSKANGDIHITINHLSYGQLTIPAGSIKAVIKNGVLKASIEELKISEGSINATTTLDASSPKANLNYEVSIAGVQARPVLITLADNDRLSGKTYMNISGSARGRSQKEFVNSLDGKGMFKFLDGAIHGINLAAKLRKAQTLGFSGTAKKTQQTDFAELGGSFNIKKGVLENLDFKMLAPLIRLKGAGKVPLPSQSVDYNITAKLVASLKGQGGKDGIVGLPIPIRIHGPWTNISYGVNWKSVFSLASADPGRLTSMPGDLIDASKNFGVNLSIPKIQELGDALTGDVLKSLPGLLAGEGREETTTDGTETKTEGGILGELEKIIPQESKTTEEIVTESAPPEKTKEEELLDTLKSLGGLFGR